MTEGGCAYTEVHDSFLSSIEGIVPSVVAGVSKEGESAAMLVLGKSELGLLEHVSMLDEECSAWALSGKWAEVDICALYDLHKTLRTLWTTAPSDLVEIPTFAVAGGLIVDELSNLLFQSTLYWQTVFVLQSHSQKTCNATTCLLQCKVRHSDP